MKILTTGTAGFIGSNFLHYMENKFSISPAVYDKFTYAGNMSNLVGLKEAPEIFKRDICDYAGFVSALVETSPDYVVHFAAESHVDRSIESPQEFLETNILGTEVILRAVKWYNETSTKPVKKLVHISTDEVYGSLLTGEADESAPFATNSPYSASKAAGDLMCRAYFKTYGVPVCIIRGSNCYGPRQYPEKLIPKSLTNLLTDQKIGIYGTGTNVREWIYTEDFCSGVEAVMMKGTPGEAYNLGGGADNRVTNLDIAGELLRLLDKTEDHLEFVQDRAGHDMRYALNSNKLKNELGWAPKYDLAKGLEQTVDWYVKNEWWWKPLL